jgi:hypothetical protein
MPAPAPPNGTNGYDYDDDSLELGEIDFSDIDAK